MQTSSVGNTPSDICVIRLSAIGDTCHALAVIRNLQDNWPDANITWIIGRTEASLLGDVAGVEFIIFDKREGRRAHKAVLEKLTARSEPFDAALCMHASMRINPLYRKLPANRKIGFDKARARDLQWLFTNERVDAAPKEHALDAMMGFARHIGAAEKPVHWDIPLPDAAREYASRITDDNTVVMSPVSSQRFRNYRNWPLDRFMGVCEHLTGRHGCRVLVSGGGTSLEHEYANKMAELDGVESIVGESNLKELVAVLDSARLVICPDSGPVHMATAVGTPVVGLYATSNPDRTGPYLHREFTVNRYPEALERYLGKTVDEVRWGQRVRHPEAMSLITVEDVAAAVDAALAKPA